MIEPDLPVNERRRLATLRAYDVLDTPPEDAFDDLTRVAAQVCGTPIALVSLVDAERQWFKSKVGLAACQTPRSVSFCGHAILRPDRVMVVGDAFEDERFRDNPLSTGKPHVRFYAGAPLVTPTGEAVGTLCVIDHQPRALTEEQVELLRVLARQVVTQLELRNACLELDDARLRAEQATEAKAHFLANMSHEIRTPMNAILGMAELLEESDLSKQQAQYVRIFRSAGRTLLDLINGILDLSKFEAGKLRLSREPFELRSLLESVVEVLAAGAHRKGIYLTCEVDPGAHDALVGDPARLRQILTNLIGNAVKFTNQGGVKLRVSQARGTDVAGCLRFAVVDTGIGICAKDQERLFQPFTQVDSSSARRYGGTGLGLNLSMRLVELMGGTIELDSAAGEGSTFSFELKLEAREEVEPGAFGPGPWMTPPRVLVVDDSRAERRMTARLLEELGCAVSEAEGGEAGERMFLEHENSETPFDVVLSDARMPQMSGVELARRLAARPGTADRTILMLPADHRRSDVESAVRLGLAGQLIKPLRRAPLREALVSMICGLTIEDRPSQAASAAAESPGAGGRPLRVLLTDDSEDNRFLVSQFLADGAYELECAESGEQGLEEFRTAPPDLVLMDLQLPGMDGLETIRRMRAWEGEQGRPRTPILALTADAMPDDRARCLKAGADEHLAKPISKRQLLEAVQRHGAAPALPAQEDIPQEILALRATYLKRTRSNVQLLGAALEASDFETLQRLGHNMKGTGKSFGLPELSEIGGALEHSARRSDLTAARSLVAALQSRLDQVGPDRATT